MNAWLGSDPLFYPSISPAVLDFIRSAYALLLTATLVAAMPHARRYFLSERWGGYAESGHWIDWVQNPVVLPAIMAAWLAAAALRCLLGRTVVLAAFANVFFAATSSSRCGGEGCCAGWAPRDSSLTGSALQFCCSNTRAISRPNYQGLALLVLQVDFALIMLSAGMYKFSAGYRQNDGMELGMVNPEWGYWSGFWRRFPPGSPWFRLFNEMAWGTEVVGALLMLVPPTRFLGGLLILVSFVFIATQIRLGFLCEMVIVCCLLFAHPGSAVDPWLSAALPAQRCRHPVASPMANARWCRRCGDICCCFRLHAPGFAYNLYAKKTLPAPVPDGCSTRIRTCSD